MEVRPVSNSFLIASIIGFLISVFYVYDLNPKFGFAFAVVFFVMFAASIMSITSAQLPEHIDQGHKKKRRARH